MQPLTHQRCLSRLGIPEAAAMSGEAPAGSLAEIHPRGHLRDRQRGIRLQDGENLAIRLVHFHDAAILSMNLQKRKRRCIALVICSTPLPLSHGEGRFKGFRADES